MTRKKAIEILENHTQYFVSVQDLVALNMALHPVSREQVEKVWRGEWKNYLPPLGAGNIQYRCTTCGRTPEDEMPFCPYCGAAMTDEAVQMVMERLEALYEHNA